MWLLADLFHELPEVGDVDKPKLVFFFDEAHLLFDDASKEFLDAIAQTVRLIRSKGVGVFFVTQTPKDVPADVLAQLGNRVQHALRAFTPEDAKALKATVSTFPNSGYDLEEVLTQLGIGEAMVTVLSERGAPTPVAWTRLPAAAVADGPGGRRGGRRQVAGSPLFARQVRRTIDRESAYEMLLARGRAVGTRHRPPKRRRRTPRPRRSGSPRASRSRRSRPREGDRVVRVPRRVRSRGDGDRPRDRPLDLRHPPPLRTCRRSVPVGGAGVAEDARFELARVLPQHAFQACAIGH